VKQLRQIAGAVPAAPRKASDAAQLALMQILTPEQFQSLTPDQVQNFSESLRRVKRVLMEVNAAHEADAQAPEDISQTASYVEPFVDAPSPAEPVPYAETDVPAVQAIDAAEMAATEPTDKEAAAQNAVIDETSPVARNGHQPVSKKTPPEPRHPEWPAESFLSRFCLPPKRNLAVNGRENGVHTVDADHERNVCACQSNAARPVGTIDISPAVHCWDADELRKHESRRDD
jgi:hypothetical protein